MRVGLLPMEYMRPLRAIARSRGYEVVVMPPHKSAEALMLKLVDAAAVSTAVASAMALSVCQRCPAVRSFGKVDNVVLVVKKWRRRMRVKFDERSFTGRALAMWYLERVEGVEVVEAERDWDAQLVIGDEARRLKCCEKVDLGEVWTKVMGVGAVYAVMAAWREPVLEVRYRWRNIEVVPFYEVSAEYLVMSKELRPYWLKLPFPPRGLLGGLLRSLK